MKVKTIDFMSENAAVEFVESLKKTGFAILKNHPISKEIIDDVYGEWNNFFNSKEKMSYENKNANEVNQSGYFPFKTETAKGSKSPDLKEFYQFYPRFKLPQVASKNTSILYEELSLVAEKLLAWLEDNSPKNTFSEINMPLKDLIKKSPNTFLRVINYPPINNIDAGSVRAAAHGDINLLTILPMSTKPGLQVMDIDGNWHDVKCEENTLAINTGDMIAKASKNFFPSTIHRVINPMDADKRKENRMSMPLFLHPRPDENLLKNLTAGQYLEKRLVDIGIKK